MCLANIIQLHFEIECNLAFKFLTLLFSTNRQKRRFLLPYECCMFCSLYFGKWQSKRYTYTQNTCPLESEEQKDLPLYYHWIQNIVQSFWCSIPNQEKHVTYTLSYRLLINYHSVENESRMLNAKYLRLSSKKKVLLKEFALYHPKMMNSKYHPWYFYI